ncbi:MAG: hypothetical protein AAF602_14420 [Myxococcota bacterium]
MIADPEVAGPQGNQRPMARAPVTLSVVPREALTASVKEEIRALFRRAIRRTDASFREAFRAMDEAWLGRTPDGALRAVAGLSYPRYAVGGRTSIVLHTTAVVIAAPFRGRGINARIGLQAWLRCRLRHPLARLYWGFTSSTVSAYLLMTRNTIDHWPRHDRPTPPEIGALMDAVGQRFEHYDASRGLVRLPEVRPPEVSADGRTDPDPDVRFFWTRNPAPHDGFGLLCVCPLTARNASRIVRRQSARWLTP